MGEHTNLSEVTFRLSRRRSSVPRARALLLAMLGVWEIDQEVVETAELVLSELVTNALRVPVPNGSITEAKIRNGSITPGKLAAGAVTAPGIADSAVSGAQVANGSLSAADLGRFWGRFRSTIGPILLGIYGLWSGPTLVVAVALIWSAHCGFDRLLGYGLKYPSAFQDTHLGRIGKAAEPK
jgi:hypothetical protein